MDPKDLFTFLNVLKYHVSPYWKGRIDEMLRRYNGPVK